MQVAKFADLLRHSQTLHVQPLANGIGDKQAVSDSDNGNDSDGASESSHTSSAADTYSGSDGDGSEGEDAGGEGWGAEARPAKAGRDAKKRQLQLLQQQKQKQGHKMKQQKVAGASAFVSSLRGRVDDDVIEEIDVGGGSEKKNRMGQRQVSGLPLVCNTSASRRSSRMLQRRLLAERKFGGQAKHVAEGRGIVEKRVKG